jgi:uncharacterized protein (DUF488 family)
MARSTVNRIYTIGHSTRSLEELIAMLKAHRVAIVADVRTVPRSRTVPHFNADVLEVELPKAGIEYKPCKQLGGLRPARKDSPNMAWRNESFRGYADYMQTPAFAEGLEGLIDIARRKPTVIMCAEAVPWRCHRSLIADALVIRGWRVLDIMAETKATPHELTSFARVSGLAITYP